jgi:hypothetical protein
VSCQSRHQFIPGRKEYPILQIEALGNIEEYFDSRDFVLEIRYTQTVSRKPGKPRNGVFVVENENWYPLSTQASNNAKTLVVATDDDGSWSATFY